LRSAWRCWWVIGSSTTARRTRRSHVTGQRFLPRSCPSRPRTDRRAADPSKPWVSVGDAVRIYLDCTATRSGPYLSGIQRVVRSIVRHAIPAALGRGIEVVPVYLSGTTFHRAGTDARGNLELTQQQGRRQSLKLLLKRAYWKALEGLAALERKPERKEWLLAPASRIGLSRSVRHALQSAGIHQSQQWEDAATAPIAFADGDILVALDLTLSRRFPAALDEVRREGVHVICVCYDLLPILLPTGIPKSFVEDFRYWCDNVLARSDAIITISPTVARDVAGFLAATHPGTPASARIDSFRLGCDVEVPAGAGAIRQGIRRLFKDVAAIPVFIAVGWLDPRKNQQMLLDALPQLHAEGVRARLVLFGKRGPAARAILARLRNEPFLKTHVTWIEDASDSEINYAYRHCTALLYPSLAEGFGLPLVEALSVRTRVFASDIPVFREIAPGHAVFFDPHDPAALAGLLARFCQHGEFAAPLAGQPFAWPDWRESADDLLRRVMRLAGYK
jgi:glycosyltransferase involved in cell wall biosynthesis